MNDRLLKAYSWILTVGGGAGLVAMTWQAAERITMLKDPAKLLSCNLNPVVDCGTVLSHRLSALFGFPNAFIGMAVFAMMFLAGVLLLTGNRPNRAFKNVILSLSTILLLFSAWFFGVSLYVIGKICIFCAVGWIASVPIFTLSLLYWADGRDGKTGPSAKLAKFIAANYLSIIVAVYAVMLALYLYNFRDYYFG